MKSCTEAQRVLDLIRTKGRPPKGGLLLSGAAGVGKTTCAHQICETLNLDKLDFTLVNKLKTGWIETVEGWSRTSSMTGKNKAVIFNECDYGSQAVIRELLDSHSDRVLFILTTNNPERLDPSVVSRCRHFVFEGEDLRQKALLAEWG